MDLGLDLPGLDGRVGPLYYGSVYSGGGKDIVRKGGYELQKGEAVISKPRLCVEIEVAVLPIGKVGFVEVGAVVPVSSSGTKG